MFVTIIYLLQCFLCFLHISTISVNIKSTANTIANTITAASAPSIVAEIEAPSITPSTNANNTANIIATIPKQLVFLSFFSLSQ